MHVCAAKLAWPKQVGIRDTHNVPALIIGASKHRAHFSHNRLWNAAIHTFLVYNDGMTVAQRDLPRITSTIKLCHKLLTMA